MSFSTQNQPSIARLLDWPQSHLDPISAINAFLLDVERSNCSSSLEKKISLKHVSQITTTLPVRVFKPPSLKVDQLKKNLVPPQSPLNPTILPSNPPARRPVTYGDIVARSSTPAATVTVSPSRKRNRDGSKKIPPPPHPDSHKDIQPPQPPSSVASPSQQYQYDSDSTAVAHEPPLAPPKPPKNRKKPKLAASASAQTPARSRGVWVFPGLCAHYAFNNTCPRGPSCPDPHVIPALRLGELKTYLCKAYTHASCPYTDESCTYAHGRKLLPCPKKFCALPSGCDKPEGTCFYSHEERFSEARLSDLQAEHWWKETCRVEGGGRVDKAKMHNAVRKYRVEHQLKWVGWLEGKQKEKMGKQAGAIAQGLVTSGQGTNTMGQRMGTMGHGTVTTDSSLVDLAKMLSQIPGMSSALKSVSEGKFVEKLKG
ncbi:hypothetical protein BJ742DRAFT_822960 [Cladochytrium replicatum]|nr:hypothetical protein BJ742DRAFT_822960 [Cladochytrium replicatum]